MDFMDLVIWNDDMDKKLLSIGIERVKITSLENLSTMVLGKNKILFEKWNMLII